MIKPKNVNKSKSIRMIMGGLAIFFLSTFYIQAHACIKTKPKAVTASGTYKSTLLCNTQPQPYNSTYSWGKLYGSTVSSTDTVNGNAQPTGYTDLQGTVASSKGAVTTVLPHSVLKVSAITLSSGTKAYKLYVSTKSAYAPNGDSGTFIISLSDQLLSGTQSSLKRLRAEVEDADPSAFISIGAIPKSFWSSLGTALSCAAAAGADVGAGLALLDPLSAPEAGSVLFGLGGWSILATETKTFCF